MVDKIERDLLTPLVIRVISGVTSFLCLYYAIKYLPIFLVSLILNTSPIFTSFLAFLVLKEKVSRTEVFALFFAFFGVYILISNSKQGSTEDSLSAENKVEESDNSNILMIPFICLLVSPLLMALTNVLLRHMKKMHEYTSSTYSVGLSMVVFGPIMSFSDDKQIITDCFTQSDYIILIMISLMSCIGMLCKAKAMQMEMASRLSILMYFSIIFTLVFDIMLIGTVFNFQEVVGMLIVFSANALSIYVIFSKNCFQKQDTFAKA